MSKCTTVPTPTAHCVCVVVANLLVSSISITARTPERERDRGRERQRASGRPQTTNRSLQLPFPLLPFFFWVRKTRSLLRCTTSASSGHPAGGGGGGLPSLCFRSTQDVLLSVRAASFICDASLSASFTFWFWFPVFPEQMESWLILLVLCYVSVCFRFHHTAAEVCRDPSSEAETFCFISVYLLTCFWSDVNII